MSDNKNQAAAAEGHSANANIVDMRELAGKYLTFQLAGEVYGIEILKVREIIGLMDITQVPRTPSHIRGVINLRGKIIPVVDMRLKFGMPEVADTEETCIIVVDVEAGESITQMGILVDSVSEVKDIAGDRIEPAPAFGGDVDSSFIRGMAKTDNQVTILLSVECVMGAQTLREVSSMNTETAQAA